MSDDNDDINPNIIFSHDQRAKLIQLINEGGQVLSEVETLNEGLNDTIKAVAEEMNIKASILKKAVKVAHKMEYGKTQREQSLLENILTVTGKTL
jgi:hypothetical protein